MEEKIVRVKGEGKKLDSKEDVAEVVDQIKKCEGLTTLQLSGNSFGVEPTKAIGECLAHKPTFTRALWSDMFVSRLKSEIPISLVALSEGIMKARACLTELDLSDNAMGPTGVEPIVKLLTSSSLYSIKVLKFNNNGLGIKGGKLLARSLLECYHEAENAGEKMALEVFVAGRNRLENEGATALAEVFQVMGSLVKVSMPQNGINAEGICALASCFSHNPNLEIIDLNDNTFTATGAVVMAEVLPELQKLRIVNFGDCLVRPEGARAIAEAMKSNHQLLEELNLSFCELDYGAGLAVAEALANKRGLEKIDLNGNCFGTNGSELLRESLEAKGCLEALGSLSDDEGSEEEDEDEGEESDREDLDNSSSKEEQDMTGDEENRGGTVAKDSPSMKREDKGNADVLAEKINTLDL